MGVYDGVIMKGIGGFYYVNTKDGIIECRARGIFRKRGFTPLVGDKVVIETTDSQHGVINEICERQNSLIRPAVANVTQMIVVVAHSGPLPNAYVIDKLIASAEFANLKIAVCFNKADLGGSENLVEVYKKSGFTVVETSVCEKSNLGELKNILCGELTVFAGNSGVGKSSLINEMLGEEMFETGFVSEKLERGRHTTRHSELVRLPFGGYIIDTPGFSSFDVNLIPKEDLTFMFREFKEHIRDCRFPDCRHVSEPDCGVLNAVAAGEIPQSRHDSYVQLLEECTNNKFR